MSLCIAILTRDRPEHIATSIAHHAALAKRYGLKLYVFDNSVKTDNSALMAKYPEVIYHKHTKDLTYDESFRYALEHMEGSYRWVISDRPLIVVGAIPYISDYLSLKKYSAIVVGSGNRLVLNGDTMECSDPDKVLTLFGWHTCLCSSVIYSEELIKSVDMDRYMGHGFIHTAIFLDGITRIKLPVLIIIDSFLRIGDMTPTWIWEHMKIWTKDLFDMGMKLPYKPKHVIKFLQANGSGGKVLSEEAFKYLIVIGALTHEMVDKYEDEIKQTSFVAIDRIHSIIDSIPRCGE